MAHFAHLTDNTVTRVIVISNADIIDADGNESEALGIALCEELAGPGPWVQTSYHSTFRRHYAGFVPDMTYDGDLDMFLFPKPYPSWVLDLDDPNDWVAPIPQPTEECENGAWTWNEDQGDWECTPLSEPQ